MLDCHHCPVTLDEAPNSSKAPTLVVCQICQEVLEAAGYEPQQHKVRYIFRLEEACVSA